MAYIDLNGKSKSGIRFYLRFLKLRLIAIQKMPILFFFFPDQIQNTIPFIGYITCFTIHQNTSAVCFNCLQILYSYSLDFSNLHVTVSKRVTCFNCLQMLYSYSLDFTNLHIIVSKRVVCYFVSILYRCYTHFLQIFLVSLHITVSKRVICFNCLQILYS